MLKTYKELEGKFYIIRTINTNINNNNALLFFNSV